MCIFVQKSTNMRWNSVDQALEVVSTPKFLMRKKYQVYVSLNLHFKAIETYHQSIKLFPSEAQSGLKIYLK